ncbi:ABC-F family ATP-binding cassette domain-containing protein [Sediminivirga luteola]|uniref:Putative ABC transporter ATP-binding protein n=1 Tax=Sediminivirga luteola TaxID=1774748 RepID=A0A8J2XKX8_9MICO|nr:ABC-F family ATP-binding cassette domain-containing protein [Sediminivirga luteola]GGA17992.1 putative ABC transporter ATP-binding protein [Sediminivirga luteola]
MPQTPASLILSEITFRLPHGPAVLDGVSFGLGPGRHALIGANGTGKSTLLKIVAGLLRPDSGAVRAHGELGYLPQDPAAAPDRPVAALLGVQATMRALAAIEAGSVREQDFETVGDDWDLPERLDAHLSRLGLSGLALDRPAGTLSGGELTLLSLTALLLRRPAVLLLDEPTNNLDRAARHRLYDAVAAFAGTLLVVSHDRELLDLVDDIGELRGGTVRWYGGGFTHYRETVAAEQEAAAQAVASARNGVRRQKRELAEQQTKQARRDKQGRTQAESLPPILAGTRKRRAQESAGRLRAVHRQRLDSARETLEEAETRLREDDVIRIDLPGTEVPGRREVLRAAGLRAPHGTAWQERRLDLSVCGPERIALTGPNGIGKTSLLRCLAGETEPAEGSAEVLVPMRYLPQRLDLLDPDANVIDNVRRFAPGADPGAIHHRLARFLLRGEAVRRPAGTLSGGERWRATLACLLLAEPAPQLLVLDEPTNNLDLAGVRHLTEALAAFRGALLVVSHDQRFIDDLGPGRRIEL